MQNKQKKNKHYVKYSRGLKNELANSYVKRIKYDNNWQFRVMNSKLQ